MNLQDAHIHLQDAGGEGRRILADAAANGVGRFFCNGTAPSDWNAVDALAREFDSVVPFFGMHPWSVDDARNGWAARLEEYLRNDASRIGEIGLDKAKRAIDFEKQLDVFRRQLDMAATMKRPFALHCVQAWEALLAELAGHIAGSVPFIVHWFSGSPETAMKLVRAGGYISFSPRLLDEGAGKQRASFENVPIGRILLETDYPYMPDSAKRSVPAAGEYFRALRALYAKAASLKSMPDEEFTRKIWDNGTVFVH